MAAKLLTDEFRQKNFQSRVESTLFFKRLLPYADGDLRTRVVLAAATICSQARSICRAAACAPDVQVPFLHGPWQFLPQN
jgi:hypothetical protein